MQNHSLSHPAGPRPQPAKARRWSEGATLYFGTLALALIALPFFLRLIEQRKAGRRDVLLDREPSVLRAQHCSIGQRLTAHLFLVPHEKPSSVWIFWLYYSVSGEGVHAK